MAVKVRYQRSCHKKYIRCQLWSLKSIETKAASQKERKKGDLPAFITELVETILIKGDVLQRTKVTQGYQEMSSDSTCAA